MFAFGFKASISDAEDFCWWICQVESSEVHAAVVIQITGTNL